MLRSNRTILNRIRKLSNGNSVRILTIKGHLINPESGESIDCRNDYGKELSACLYGLIRDGYLIQLEEYKVALTDKGIHPYAQTWEDVKHFVFHSLLVPIGASAATSLIVLWLQGLL